MALEVGGFRLGTAHCIEINFPAYPVDSIFATMARACAAIHSYWLSLSVRAPSTRSAGSPTSAAGCAAS